MKILRKGILALSLAACALGMSSNVLAASSKPVFRIFTYDEIVSYGAAKQLTPKFEAICNCKVEWNTAKHQSIMLNQALIDYKKQKYDLIMGVNIGDATRAGHRYHRYFAKIHYKPASLTNFPFQKTWDNPYALPISSSPVTVLFNKDKVSLNPSQYASWTDWITQDKTSFIFGDPSSNDLGKALNRVIAYYYPSYDEQVAAWKAIKAKTVTVGKSWSTSYGAFTKGESNSALGYASSIIYHRLVENKYQYVDLEFKKGSPYLVDSILIPANSKQPRIAQQFAKFMLEAFPQKTIFIYNSSFPVVDLAKAGVLNPKELELADKIKDFPILDDRNIDPLRIESSLKAFNDVFTK